MNEPDARTVQRREECRGRAVNASARDRPEQGESAGRGTWCPLTWDGLLCWPEAPAGFPAVQPCLDELHGIRYDTTQNATRLCLPNGTWHNHTNYSECHELLPLSVEGIIYHAGFCTSLVALVISVSIFHCFKDLKCQRNIIHTNLMWTFIFYDAMWIVIDSYLALTNNYIVCACVAALYHFFYLTNFFWMFVEGFYLFLLVVVTFTSERIKLRVYVTIGWG